MKALVVINPKAGGGKGLTLGNKVRSLLASGSDQISYVQATSLEACLSEASALCSENTFDVLVCVGGDGLIHDLLPILIGANLPLLVIPAGTGNDFARTLGVYGKKIESLLELPRRSKPIEIDICEIVHGNSGTPFVQILSTGFDSIVNERANEMRLIRGKIKYVLAVLEKVWKFRAIDFRVTIDGIVLEQRAMLVCVANGTSYGGGMKIAPHAKHDDGILDIMIVDRVNPFRLLLVFPRVFFGTHVKHPRVHFFTGKEIQISGDTVAFADGERIAKLPISISVASQKLAAFTISAHTV